VSRYYVREITVNLFASCKWLIVMTFHREMKTRSIQWCIFKDISYEEKLR